MMRGNDHSEVKGTGLILQSFMFDSAGSSKRALGSECPVFLYINCDLPMTAKPDFKVLVFKHIFMPV